jgi:hypothetical protein
MTTSLRSQLEARARREFIEQENRKHREKEDRTNYEAFVRGLREQNYRTAPANRVEIPTFEAIAAHLNPSNKNAKQRFDAAVVAYYSASSVKLLRQMVDRPLENFEPTIFQGLPRLTADQQANTERVREACHDFFDTEIRFRRLSRMQRKQVTELLAAFCDRNNLNPECRDVWAIAFNCLYEAHLIPAQAEPEHEPEVPVESDEARQAREELDRATRRRAYRERVVVTDPRNGHGYTQYQLDNEVTADEYVRLLGLARTDARVNIPSRRA